MRRTASKAAPTSAESAHAEPSAPRRSDGLPFVREGSAQAFSKVVDLLPWIDDHALVVDTPVTEVWKAVLDEVDRATSGPLATAYARCLGCKPSRSSGTRPLEVGSTVPGFTVTSASVETELVLTGHHVFSTYELIFRLRSTGSNRTEIRAESRAAFPAVHGRLYRLLVIDTGFHVRAVRRLLGSIRQKAEERSRRHVV